MATCIGCVPDWVDLGQVVQDTKLLVLDFIHTIITITITTSRQLGLLNVEYQHICLCSMLVEQAIDSHGQLNTHYY
jgi:hypothetical protein